ncbi:hypothetical protein [Trujillonella humicola]|uniref:hypothetical protein n=1 Tax=Trujillonella humicola TaxID=3383699 RepID=UPI0039064B8D
MTDSICEGCGTGLPYGAGWCPGCGAPLTAPPAVPAAAAPHAPQWTAQQPADPSAHGLVLPPALQPRAYAYGQAPFGQAPSTGHAGGPAGPPRAPGAATLEALLSGDWLGALRSAALAVVAMLAVSLVGMLLIANGQLGFRETLVLILGGACLAVGGDMFGQAEASSFDSGAASVSVGILPLTVTVVGLLVLGSSFARRLRRRGVTGDRDVVLQLVRTSLLFAVLFLPLSLLTHYRPDRFGDDALADLVDVEGRIGVGVWSTLSGALLFAVAATGLVSLLRGSGPLLGRFRPRVFPALMGALAVFATGALAMAVFVVWGLTDIPDGGAPTLLGVSLLGFVNGMLAAVLWTAGVQLTGQGGLAGEFTRGSDSIDLLTFTDISGFYWLAPVVLFVVMLCVAVVVVIRQHTLVEARLEGLRFAAALAVVALAAALLLRIVVQTSAGGGPGFGASTTASATFNPFLAAFVLALWGAVTGLIAPAIAAGLPPGMVQALRRRFGMGPQPASVAPAPVAPPAPPQQWS